MKRGTEGAMFDFSGKAAAITGASGIGIGRDIAGRLYRSGASIAICSRSAQRIAQAAAEIGAERDPRVFAMEADVSKASDAERFVLAAAERFGRLDILINNAGVQYPKPSVDVTEDDWERTMDTNLKAYFFAARQAAKIMLKNGGGAIVNIGSVHAAIVQNGQAVYASSKAAVSQLTKNIAREWGRENIRVNCVAPGSVPTLINRDIYSDPATERAMCEKIPMGRRGTTREIADAALYLASEYASYVTGQTLFVDGGLTLVHG
jgi:NAD(P)-dependent dehydrogenase (short-subunit alcohol dehydrogenase family)